ncbi:MAG: histidine kinase [Proteobacteria bacterium]|nr:histidine kinase [Pseudomonadota bacterium]
MSTPADPRPTGSYPLDALWRPSAILWVALTGIALAAVLTLAPGVGSDRWIYFGLILLVIQWISLLTLGALYLLRRPLSRLRPPRVAYVAVLLLLLGTWLVGSAAWLLMRGIWPEAGDDWPSLMLRLTAIALAVGVLGLAAFRNHWRARQLAVRAKQAELEALQARIRPHFLFNTLNTGAALVHQRPGEAERLLLDLADLFRAALAGPHQVSLEDELALARRYLEIEALRFGERLQVRWELPRDLPPVTVPALSIQPLVENAIRHGVERLPGGEVEVAVSTTSDTVVVRISNPLPRPDGAARPGHQVGLNASQVRIEALTGGRGSVQTQVVGDRFVATVRLPLDASPAL